MWALVLAERPLILSRVRRRVDEAFVEDVVQVILARAALLIASDRADFDEARNVTNAVRAWLHEILKRVCAEIRRSEVKAKRAREELHREDAIDPMPRLIAREELAQIPIGLRRLDLETLDVFARCGGSVTIAARARGDGFSTPARPRL
jgi:DNA-directed RNA polymerase specialized sigma24 family protein